MEAEQIECVLYVVYGGAFIVVGCALGLQARIGAMARSLPSRAVWLLAGFALIHGLNEWSMLPDLVDQGRGGRPVGEMRVVGTGLLAASFVLLLAFGIDLLERERRRSTRALIGSAVALGALALLGWSVVAASRVPSEAGALDRIEVAIRYGLGVPAAFFGALGLRSEAARLAPEDWHAARLVRWASLVLLAYAVLGGLVVPVASFPPATVMNVATFRRSLHLRVEILRAASVVALGLLLSEAFARAAARRLRSEVEHEFVSLVAHELRSPLNVVQSAAWLLDRLPRSAHATEREQRTIHAILGSCRSMRRMVEDLLQASRIGTQRLTISCEKADLRPVVARAVEWAGATAGDRQIATRFAPDVPPVLADATRVEQVLGNLLSNAVKYSPRGSEIRLEVAAQEGGALVSVTNEGQGIPRRDLPRLFSRSYRTASAERSKAPGLGLGLYIARGLVEAHGGRIWGESEPGRRTTFCFTLPAWDSAHPAAGEGAQPSSGREPG
jgi:signal transduction histidine kinase